MHQRNLALALLVLLLGASLPIARADEPAGTWPSFRGPLHTGVAPDADPPLVWSEEKNVRFKVKLEGKGHASPVVWGNRIYVLSAEKTERVPQSRIRPSGSEILLASQEQRQQQQQRRERPPRVTPTHVYRFLVSAYDFTTGELVWKTVVREEVPHESLHSTASQASASPVTDGKHVWAFFGSRGLHCVDKDGRIVWQADLGRQSTRNEFGEGSSPVVHGKLVLVNWDHEGDSFIVAFDKKTGKERWRVARDEPTSWSTPLVVEDGDREIVVVSAANRVRGYDLDSGKEVWSVGGLGLNVIPTPVADGETVWVMSGWREAHGMAIRYTGARGDLGGSERVVWETDRGLSYVPSAVLVDGRIYFFQRFTGILSCYELSSGKACYDQQRIEGFENVYASPVAAGDRIYSVSRDGAAIVFRAGDKFEVLARNELDDVFNATPAIVGDAIVLRGDSYLYRIEKEGE
jgi:outer membrane protein assembly factor BamB